MLELGISQAQTQFTKILNQKVMIVDKKAHQKKAVIIPYDEYFALVNKAKKNDDFKDGIFNEFIGVLDDEFETDDIKYNKIVK